MGGAVAEWSKALLEREKINENRKIPGSPPGLGNLKKCFSPGILGHLLRIVSVSGWVMTES